jgi:hypothetical protein
LGHTTTASPGGVDHGLGKGEQCFARAIDRQHLRGGVHGQAVAALQPGEKGLAQAQIAGRGRIAGQAIEVGADGMLDELGRGVAGLAHAQADGAQAAGGCDPREKLPQPLERVGLQVGKQGIHVRDDLAQPVPPY